METILIFKMETPLEGPATTPCSLPGHLFSIDLSWTHDFSPSTHRFSLLLLIHLLPFFHNHLSHTIFSLVPSVKEILLATVSITCFIKRKLYCLNILKYYALPILFCFSTTVLLPAPRMVSSILIVLISSELLRVPYPYLQHRFLWWAADSQHMPAGVSNAPQMHHCIILCPTSPLVLLLLFSSPNQLMKPIFTGHLSQNLRIILIFPFHSISTSNQAPHADDFSSTSLQSSSPSPSLSSLP